LEKFNYKYTVHT